MKITHITVMCSVLLCGCSKEDPEMDDMEKIVHHQGEKIHQEGEDASVLIGDLGHQK